MKFILNTCPVETLAEYNALRAATPHDIIPCAGEPVAMRDGVLQVYARNGSGVVGWYSVRADIFTPDVCR